MTIDEKFNLHTSILGLGEIRATHSAENIIRYVDGVLSRVQLDTLRISGSVIDNGRNIIKAMKQRNWIVGRCGAHILQLVIHHGFKAVPEQCLEVG